MKPRLYINVQLYKKCIKIRENMKFAEELQKIEQVIKSVQRYFYNTPKVIW